MSHSWLEALEAFIADVIADNDLDEALAWEEIRDRANDNIDLFAAEAGESHDA